VNTITNIYTLTYKSDTRDTATAAIAAAFGVLMALATAIFTLCTVHTNLSICIVAVVSCM